MQKTVIDVFPRDRILTPREVRGDYATLAEAVQMTTASEPFIAALTWPTGDAPDAPDASGDSGDSGAVPMTFYEADKGVDSGSYRNSESDSSSAADLYPEEGVTDGEGMAGGWPKVDATRGKVLFVIDYQSINLVCRPAVRKVLLVYVFLEYVAREALLTPSDGVCPVLRAGFNTMKHIFCFLF